MGEPVKSGTKYGELKTETEYLKKLTADVINRFGDSLDMIVFGWMVYALTGSAALSAVTVAVNTLVTVLLSPFSAALITGLNKKAIIVPCDIGRGALVTITALLYFAGILQPWMIILITGLNSTLESFRQPAGLSVMPLIISKEKYTLGVSLSGALSRTAELIGMGIVGVLVRFIGISGVLLVDAATFFMSAIILSTLKLPAHVKEPVKNAFGEFVRNTKDGFAYAKSNKIVLAVCGIGCFLNFAFTPFDALQAAYVTDSLCLGVEAMSVIGVSISAGMGFGSFIVPKLIARFTRFKIFFAGNAMLCLSFLAVAFLPGIPGVGIWISLTAVMLILGVGVGFTNTTAQISFMENIDKDYLARMGGIMSSTIMAAMPVAALLSAGLAKLVSVTGVFLIFGIFSVAATIAMLFIKTLRQL